MHYSNLVIIETTDDVEKAVEQAMGASEDQGGFWDWYQIGGRWTGVLDGYEPDEDPRNVEECFCCGGTGFRNDAIGKQAREREPSYTCNGCGDIKDGKWTHGKHGPGKHTSWSYAKHPGDIAPIDTLTEEAYGRFYRIVTPYARTFGGDEYMPWKETGECFKRREKPPLDWLKKEYEGHIVVVVDNHS